MTEHKTALRKSLLAGRRALSPGSRATGAKFITRHVQRLSAFKSGSRVAIYVAFGSEVDTNALIRAAHRRGVRLYVPLILDHMRRRMRFVSANSRKPNAATAFISARWFNLILLPVVGVDAHGYRLGMGAGFYDRVLSYRRTRGHWNGPRLVALAFDYQRVASVHPQSWDARLDAVVTESGLHVFHRGPA